ncbi:MAG: hypothetical protein J6C66_06080 [Prevotella sp.]|nr:hypothetical protein [Prevotella sp.]
MGEGLGYHTVRVHQADGIVISGKVEVDCDAKELVEMFAHIMSEMTFSDKTIAKALSSVAEEYK